MNFTAVEQAKKLNVNAFVDLLVVLAKKDILLKANKEEYLSLTVFDNSGSFTFPIWDDVARFKDLLEENKVYQVSGLVGFYQGNLQIKSPTVVETAEDPKQFLPKYEIPQELRDYFNQTIANLESPWQEFVIACLKKVEVDKFLTCPAATRHHHNRLGGLFLHTVGLMKNVDNIISLYCDKPFWNFNPTVINPSRLRAKAILHDIMKIKEYTYDTAIGRNKYAADHRFMGVGLFQSINDELKLLSEEELDSLSYSVLSHHGRYGEEVVPPKYIEDVLLHSADMIDSQIIKSAETGDPKIY